MVDEVKEFKASEVIKEANKAMEKSDKIEKKVEKKEFKKVDSKENKTESFKTEEKQVFKPEVKEAPKPKKKGKVIAVRKASIIVLDENGKGVTLFGYKNVKVGDTVVY